MNNPAISSRVVACYGHHMKKQFIVQKYVMADSVKEAIEKSRHIPIHEVYIHNQWFDKIANFEFSPAIISPQVGFNKKHAKRPSNKD